MTMREVGRPTKRPAARSGSITPAGKAVYQPLARRALAGERFTFPADLTALALTHRSQSLIAEERADAQRWALELSQIADPKARQATLATAPAHWQATIRHYLAWRVGMGALRATLRRTEPPTGEKPTAGKSI